MQAPCRFCGKPVDYEPAFAVGQEYYGVSCQECVAGMETDRRDTQRRITLARNWEALCPSRFRDTVFDCLPCREKSQTAVTWDFQDGQGLNLWGIPNTGKTRTLYLVIEHLHFAGKRCVAFSPADFMAMMERRQWRRGAWVQHLAGYDVVAFDDIDKLSLTGPQEKVFFALLDKRMAMKMPCLFTHNSNADQLEYQFKTGPALVRRIRQFTKSLHFP